MLSTVGKVVLEKDVQGIWRGGLNWLVDRIRPAGRSLARDKHPQKRQAINAGNLPWKVFIASQRHSN